MKTNYFNLQVIGFFLLTLIPWPGPTVFKISCPRENARIVRKIIQSKWLPILQKYKVSLPLECPFHQQREIFWPQQAAKHKHRPSQWTCGLCGKSFFEERFLDTHFDNRHNGNINIAEDAVCLADYCDIMRCDVLLAQDPKIIYPDPSVNTDIEIWREASSYTKALTATGPRDIARYTAKLFASKKKTAEPDKTRCQQTEAPADTDASIKGDSSNERKQQNRSYNVVVCNEDLVDSSVPTSDNRQQRIAELQKLKSNCKPEELVKLKTKCEILVRDCIASLLIQLSLKDFKEIEDELNRAVCWYLTCDRYWEDSHSDIRTFPWGLLCMIIMVLSLGICLCYYIIWVLFDTDDVSVTSASITDRSTPSPAHLLARQDAISIAGSSHPYEPGQHPYAEDYYAVDKDNEYIYVTYPPDLKRRLLESPQPTHRSVNSINESLPEREISSNNLQHISEREADDGDTDPSQDPTVKTLFLERSKVELENGLVRRKTAEALADIRPLKKSSSCSTIYLDDSTVSQPNLKNTVKCVALAIYFHIKNRVSERQIDIFDEKLHPLTRETVNDDYDKHNPEHRHIYKFVRTLFNAAQLTAECAIITLVYLERLLTYSELDIAASNWKRIVLAAILLASKVWDDQAVWNVDYCQILKDITVEDMNELERQFLELLQFNINVPSSVYAKYYFDLRTLAKANDLTFPSEPLSNDRAQKLEAMSRVMEDKYTQEALKNGFKKWSSMDNINMNGCGGVRKSVAILS